MYRYMYLYMYILCRCLTSAVERAARGWRCSRTASAKWIPEPHGNAWRSNIWSFIIRLEAYSLQPYTAAVTNSHRFKAEGRRYRGDVAALGFQSHCLSSPVTNTWSSRVTAFIPSTV